MSESKKYTTTPPSWVTLSLCAMLLIVFYWMNGGEEGKLSFPYTVCMIIVFCLIVSSGKHYSFTSEHLIVKFFGIPVRRILWREVSSAVYVRTWRENGNFRYRTAPGIMKGHLLIVSLGYCPPFNPEYSVRTTFAMQNPFGALFVELPEKTHKEYLSVFMMHFPDLKYQAEVKK